MLLRRNTHLEDSYRAAAYFVDGPFGRFALRIDQTSAEVDALAALHHVNSWTYITAYNPGSIALPTEQNEKRQQQLEQAVAQAGYVFYRGEGTGDDGWPAEPSLLVLGIPEGDAAAMSRRFGQLAVLVGERGERVRLLWTDEQIASTLEA